MVAVPFGNVRSNFAFGDLASQIPDRALIGGGFERARLRRFDQRCTPAAIGAAAPLGTER